MKKFSKLSWGILVLGVLVLAGCGYVKKESQGPGAPAENSQTVAEKVKESLFDMVAKGAGAKCTVDDPQSGQLTMYTKGDKVKVKGFQYMAQPIDMTQDSQPSEPKMEKGTMINDGAWVYIWSGTEGMKFNIKEMEKLFPKDQAQNEKQFQDKAFDWKDWVKDMDNQRVNYDCSPAVLSDADFMPPSDVKFQDWGEMMKGLMQTQNQMQSKMPQGIPNQPPAPAPTP